jgi:type 1 fimbria pilin
MKKLFLISFLWICTAASSLAASWTSDITLSPQPMSFSGPADSVVVGKIIGSTWSATATVSEVVWCGRIQTCQTGTMEPGSGAVSTGMTVAVDGENYTIFETGVQGVGFILGLKDPNGTVYMPLQNGQTQTYPASGTNGYATGLGFAAKVTFVKTRDTLATGIYTTPTISAALLTVKNNETTTAQVIINPTTIIVSATGCTVLTKTANVDLGTVDVRTLPAVGSTSPSGTFNVSLYCDQKVSVNATLSDQTHPANYSSAVSLTSDSNASGVGVQFLYNGTVLALGADSSASGNLNQFFIQTTDQAQTLNLPFEARYIRMGDIEPGTANALAGITFSYQ